MKNWRDLHYIDAYGIENHIFEANLLNRAVGLLNLINYADKRIRSQRSNIATWKPYDFGCVGDWEKKLRATKAARLRIIKSYQETITKLNRIAFTFES